MSILLSVKCTHNQHNCIHHPRYVYQSEWSENSRQQQQPRKWRFHQQKLVKSFQICMVIELDIERVNENSLISFKFNEHFQVSISIGIYRKLTSTHYITGQIPDYITFSMLAVQSSH